MLDLCQEIELLFLQDLELTKEEEINVSLFSNEFRGREKLEEGKYFSRRRTSPAEQKF